MNVLVIHNYLHDLRAFVLDRTLKCLRGAGHSAHVITPDNPRYSRLRFSRTYRKWTNDDVEALTAATINAYCRSHSIDVVLPADIGSTLLLAQIRQAITPARTIPLADPETLALLHNKGRFMAWLGEHGLPRPTTQIIAADTPLDQLDVRYPLIAKPLEDCSSRGVEKVGSPDELRRYAEGHRRQSAEPFLIQSFISGDDLVFGVLAEHGRVRAWTIQRFCHASGAELEHLEYIEHPELLRCGEELVRLLNFHGIAEFDVRLDAAGRVWFIECNPRVWASIAISMAMGVNFVDLGIKLALGQPFADARPALGPFVWPERAVARLLRRQMRLRDLTPQNRQGIVAEVSDVIPFAYTVYDYVASK